MYNLKYSTYFSKNTVEICYINKTTVKKVFKFKSQKQDLTSDFAMLKNHVNRRIYKSSL